MSRTIASHRSPASLVAALAVAALSSGCSSSSPGAGPKGESASTGADSGPAAAAEKAAFALDEGGVTLAAGQEGLFCKQMAIPAAYATPDYFVTGIEADVSLGTHHLIVTASDDAPGSVPTLCKDTGKQPTTGGASFQDFAVNPDPSSVFETLKRVGFGGGGGTAKIHFPKGYGKPMPLGFFESSHHVLNLGADPVDIHGRYDIFAATGDTIEHPMGVIFANALQVDVPPNSEGSVEGTFTVPQALDVVVMTSHAHNFLKRFEMAVYRGGVTDATPLYVTEDYESPLIQVQDPPLHLDAGDGITFRCTYQNDTAKKLNWGVVGGEMCMPFLMYADPPGAPRRVPPTMSVAMSSAKPIALAEGSVGFGG
jgi:hypothetical protein